MVHLIALFIELVRFVAVEYRQYACNLAVLVCLADGKKTHIVKELLVGNSLVVLTAVVAHNLCHIVKLRYQTYFNSVEIGIDSTVVHVRTLGSLEVLNVGVPSLSVALVFIPNVVDVAFCDIACVAS